MAQPFFDPPGLTCWYPNRPPHEYRSFPLLLCLSYEDDLEWSGGLAALVNHLPDWGRSAILPLSAPSTYWGDHGVAVVPSVVEQGLNLGGYGEVRVLAVAGYPGVEGRRGRELVLLLHIEDVASLATCPVSRFFISHNNHRLTSPPIECPYSTCPRSPTVVLETWPETPILPKPSFS